MSLKDLLIEEILESGPMPFEEFMRAALYDPRGGFFTSGSLRSQRDGDFLTSPEMSPLFGETLATYIEEERDRIGEPFQVVEVGAGSGSLLGPILDRLDVDAVAVETSPAARERLSALLPDGAVIHRMPEVIRGVIMANELIDNFPMALAQRVEGGWRERWVGVHPNGLTLVDAPPRSAVEEWLDRYAGEVGDGAWVEVQLESQHWVRDALDTLHAGTLLVIDYGDTTEGLIPRRRDGTLRTYRAHHLGPDFLEEPGNVDITADVNFTPLLDAAFERGAKVDLHRQDDFLAGLGLRQRLGEWRHAELAAASTGDVMERLRLRALRTEAETLLHPRGLGDFRVMVARI